MLRLANWAGWLLLGTLLICFFTVCSCIFIENEEEIYKAETAQILRTWKSVIDSWEKAARAEKLDSDRMIDARVAQAKMQDCISQWDTVEPPAKFREYHRWVRRAMDYEREAFRVMAEYYELGGQYEPDLDELRRLRNLAVELWLMKDKALLEAKAAYPEK